jgi:cyclophilin family peptidyl-prolyl cis-trans isomerase
LALSNKGKDTNGSQFFITLDDLPFLDNKYTIIGRIVKGYEIVKRISTTCGDIEGNTKCVVKIEKGGIYKYDEYKKKNRNFKL